MSFRKLLLIVPVLFFCSSSPTGPSIDPARKIAYVVRNQIGYTEDGMAVYEANIFLVNSDGSETVQLTDSGRNENPKFSPDGSRIAFSSYRDGSRQIYIMNINGSNQKRITFTNDGIGRYEWSPDGSQIAFIRRSGNNAKIYIMDSDGSNIRQITDEKDSILDFDWSPDGSRLVYVGTINENGFPPIEDIYTIETDGSNEMRLTSGFNHTKNPDFSPDGERIVWMGNGRIYIMNTDGTDGKELTTSEDFATRPSFSPDGNRILFWSQFPQGIYVFTTDGSNRSRSATGSRHGCTPAAVASMETAPSIDTSPPVRARDCTLSAILHPFCRSSSSAR